MTGAAGSIEGAGVRVGGGAEGERRPGSEGATAVTVAGRGEGSASRTMATRAPSTPVATAPPIAAHLICVSQLAEVAIGAAWRGVSPALTMPHTRRRRSGEGSGRVRVS